MSTASASRFAQLLGFDAPVQALRTRYALGVAALAAALGGFGVILWVAANWEVLGRFGQFALLEGLIVGATVAALFKPTWRVPLSLMAVLCTGALLAYFGQTYQTGADPWQLFALWAALTLPACLGARSDLTWVPWVLVSFIGISLRQQSAVSDMWQLGGTATILFSLSAWGLALAITGMLSAYFRRWTGAGIWAWRLAFTASVLFICFNGAMHLFNAKTVGVFYVGLLTLGLLANFFMQRRNFDVLALSMAGLGINMLMLTGIGNLLLSHGFQFMSLIVLGLCTAGLLAATASFIRRLNQRYTNDQREAS